MRGRKPQPSAMKICRGNPGKRPLNPDEPQPEVGDVEPPDWLSAKARDIWNLRAPELMALGVLTGIDADTFGAYCQTCVDYLEAVDNVKRHGSVVRVNAVVGKGGKLYGGTAAPSPWVRIREKSLARMQSLGAEFGLSASSRSRVHVTGKAKKTTVQRFQDSAPKLRVVK